MTPAEYQGRIDSCKTRKDLVTLKENTLKKNRPDLAAIADKFLIERFPIQNRWTASSGKSRVTIPYEQAKENYRSHPSLTPPQIEFLAKHGIPEERIFNATNMAPASRKQRMGEGDYDIAYGTNPCDSGGHTLRTSAGHCIQCSPMKLSFLLRHRSPGEVYVAESKTETTIVKVGIAKSSTGRLSRLNSEQYAGRHDWSIRYHHGVANMGVVESEVHAALSQFAIADRYYVCNGQKTLCREIFSCSVDVAINAMKKVIAKHA